MKNLYLTVITISIFVQTMVAQVPTIVSFSPSSGTVGTSVTITGTNFNPTSSNNIVYFGATKAIVGTASTTDLTVTVPLGTTYEPITVLNIATGLIAVSDKPFRLTFSCGLIGNTSIAPKVDYVSGTNPNYLAIKDIDGDGKSDIIVTNLNSNTVSVYRNISVSGIISSNSFASKVDFATGVYPECIAFGDINGDGKCDMVITNRTSNTVSVFKNTSTVGNITSGSFASKVDFSTGMWPFGVDIADMDADGRLDMIVTNYHYSANSVSVFKNLCLNGDIDQSCFASKVDFPTGDSPIGVSVGEINGDGKPDIVIANWGGSSVSVLRNISINGIIDINSFYPKIDFTASPNPRDVKLADMDGDGKNDIIVTKHSSIGGISILRNTSTTGNITASSFASNVDISYPGLSYITALSSIADMDGDGKPDIISTYDVGPKVSIFRNNCSVGSITAGNFASSYDYPTGNVPFGISIGDLDGDAKPEIVIANNYSNNISVYRNLGSGQSPIVTASTVASIICAGASTTINGTGASQYSWMPGNLTGSSITVTPASTTTYTVTGSVSTGCIGSSTSTITISVNPLPTINPISNQTYCNGQTVPAIILTGSPSGVTFDITGGAARGLANQSGVTTIPSFNAISGSSIITITPKANGCIGTPFTFNLTVNVCSPVVLNLKLYIQGYYQGLGLMQPVIYNQGEITDSNSTQTDNVIVELHSTSPPYAMVKTTIAALNRNGTLTCSFSGSVTNTSYYIVVHHRNSIVTWSTAPVTMIPNTTYDFSNAASKAYGNNQVDVSGNGTVWAFFNGDINQDENTDLLDMAELEADINNFLFGYFATDLNGDGNVDLLDSPLMEDNITNFIFSHHP